MKLKFTCVRNPGAPPPWWQNLYRFFPASAEVHQKELRLGSQVASAADMSWNARKGFNQEGRTIQSIFSVILTEQALSMV